jgi:hypothetical protein
MRYLRKCALSAAALIMCLSLAGCPETDPGDVRGGPPLPNPPPSGASILTPTCDLNCLMTTKPSGSPGPLFPTSGTGS